MTTVPPGIIRMIRDRVRAGDYTVGPHIWQHMQAEGFSLQVVRQVVLDGFVIEWMSDRQRLLICGRARNRERQQIWLHVVCEYVHPELAGLVTSYIPDVTEWENPPLRRRR